jgi:hypothetical protein
MWSVDLPSLNIKVKIMYRKTSILVYSEEIGL